MEGEGGCTRHSSIIPFDIYKKYLDDDMGVGRSKSGYVVGALHRNIHLIEGLPLNYESKKPGMWIVVRRDETSFVGPDLFQILWDITLPDHIGQIMPDGSLLTPTTAECIVNQPDFAQKVNTAAPVYRKKRAQSASKRGRKSAGSGPGVPKVVDGK